MARVIRGSGSVVPGEVVDAHQEAERIVAEAEAEAERIVAEAKSKAEESERTAKEEGRRVAETEAAALLLTAEKVRRSAIDEARATIADLAIAAAEHIIAEELALDPERIQSIVRDVAGRARRAHRIEVRVHPEDVAHLGDAFADAEIVQDGAVGRGGCVVTTDLGQLDARLSVRLDALRKRLEQA
jgi:type III secretion system HrpE/YscL family protein